MKKHYIFLLLIISIIIACSNDNKPEEKQSQSKIELSDRIIVDEELNISYRVPIDWEEMPAALSEKHVARLRNNNKNDFVLYTPKSFFYNKENSALLRVGKVSLKDKLKEDVLTPQVYVELFKKYNGTLSIEQKRLSIKDKEIIELLIEKGNLLSFKYILNNYNNQIIQLDYSISKKDFVKMKPNIDASVQSIAFL